MPEDHPQQIAPARQDYSIEEVLSVSREIASLEAGDIGHDEFCARIAKVHAAHVQRMH